jgi:ABC-type bacteriocin/lantibiotic exporter with double-glycine peptidase domain
MISWLYYLKHALSRNLPQDPILKNGKYSSTKKNLRNLKPFVFRHWKKGLVGALLVIFTAILSFPAPMITRFLIDNVIINKQMGLLVGTILLLGGIKLAEKFSGSFQQFYFKRFEQEVILDIQHHLLDHTLKSPKSFFDSRETGYLMSRLLTDVQGLNWFFSSTLVYIISSILRFIGGVVLLIYLKWQLALLILLVLPGIIFIVRFFAKKSRVISHQDMEQRAVVSRSMQETLSTTSLIKSYSSEKKTVARLMKQLRAALNINLENTTIHSAAGLTIGFLPEVARLLVFAAGAYWIIIGEWTIGSLLAFQAYIGYVYGPAQYLATANINLQSALASLERVSALFDIVPEENLEKGRQIEKLKGHIEFKNVFFSYDGKEEILENVSFKAAPGEWIAVVGPSGVGKTTLLSLILSFYKPTKGEILFDNVPVSQYHLKGLRRRIGYVSQHPVIVSGTIMENLLYGEESTKIKRESVIKAAKTAGIHDFIESLPNTYQEELGELGVNLSEGERQRLALARALVKDPDIFILDEPTAALDSILESSIFKGLPKLLKKKTLFLVSHRLSTVKNTNKVLLLNEAKLVAAGTHQELMEKSRYYNHLMDIKGRDS